MTEYIKCFICGGALCAIAQILIDRTRLTPARILTGYVTAGVILTFLGPYGYLAELCGCGATVPLTGFGYALMEGVRKAVAENGPIGILTGGLSGTAGGIAAAILFSLAAAVFFRSKAK